MGSLEAYDGKRDEILDWNLKIEVYFTLGLHSSSLLVESLPISCSPQPSLTITYYIPELIFT